MKTTYFPILACLILTPATLTRAAGICPPGHEVANQEGTLSCGPWTFSGFDDLTAKGSNPTLKYSLGHSEFHCTFECRCQYTPQQAKSCSAGEVPSLSSCESQRRSKQFNSRPARISLSEQKREPLPIQEWADTYCDADEQKRLVNECIAFCRREKPGTTTKSPLTCCSPIGATAEGQEADADMGGYVSNPEDAR